ncbi:MAG: carbohydrate binding family 9 domain-containing protein [Bacteroidales bacterium]|nr:carbohydrate binding family 9 domain-containing protein [Bacteroidales bacterium]
MQKLLIITIFLLISFLSFSQEKKKEYIANRINQAPVIDGNLDDECWKNIPSTGEFIQYEPFNGKPASQKTEVKIAYDNTAIYFGVYCYDSNPDSILTELCERDNDDVNADWFNVDIGAFRDGLNAFSFGVTSVGVQLDSKISNDDNDHNWDAVWESSTSIVNDGWIVEMKIPYSALRFPKKDVQDWDINMWRQIRRYREWSTWNYVDRNQSNVMVQYGVLKNLENIKPPLRLSFVPYLSGYLENQSGNKDWGYSFNGGMDLKYGINQSFTLDMTLIPDFGQVQSDDYVLNLSPFETYYEEKRQFFTEGTELFGRCELFYSRRIGSEPVGFYDVFNEEIDSIIENPVSTSLINASKISGRTKAGLGIGIFNGMTAKTVATVLDTADYQKEYTTQPFTNYNMIILDQNILDNSYISLVNTNVKMNGFDYMANLTGTEFYLAGKDNVYAVEGLAVVSNIYDESQSETGYKYELDFGKQSGSFQWAFGHEVLDNKFDPNDMGYLDHNDYVETGLELSYNIFKPFGKFLSARNRLDFYREALFTGNKFAGWGINCQSYLLTKKHLSFGFGAYTQPTESYDYFEARTPNKVFNKPGNFGMHFFVSPDYRKKFLIDARAGFEINGEYKNLNAPFNYNFNIGPRIRFSNRWLLTYSFNYSFTENDYGFYSNGLFGERNLKTISNTINTSYIFNNKAALNLRLRHYWSIADYGRLFNLENTGYLSSADQMAERDINFNSFSVDLVFKWQFAPGSEMSVVWKNNILDNNDIILVSYWENLDKTLNLSQLNSFSIKILYYLDYMYLMKKK